MSFSIVRFVIECTLILAITRGSLGTLWWWETRRGSYPPANAWLNTGYVLLAASVLLPIAMRFVGSDLLFLAPFEIGFHPTMGNLQLGLRFDSEVKVPVTGRPMAFPSMDAAWAHWIALIAGVLTLMGAMRLVLQNARLYRICRRATTWKVSDAQTLG